MKTLYYSFVYPYFLYNIEAWGNTCKSFIEPLFRRQKRAIRVVAGVRRNAHTEPLFKELKILTLQQMYLLSIQVIMYKWYHEKLPPIFKDFFVRVQHTHRTRAITNTDILLKRPHLSDLSTVTGMRSIRYTGVICHNFFSLKLSYRVSFSCYKSHLKQYLLDNEVNLMPYTTEAIAK